MNQHEFIMDCLQFYEVAGMAPEKGWEKAHYPVPDCMGGSETVWLTHDHHAVHGVLQSLELGIRCFYPLTKPERLRIFSGPWEWLLGDYDRILSEDSKRLSVHLPHDFEHQSKAGKKGGKARASQPSFREAQREGGLRGGQTNVESGHMEALKEHLTGLGWWVTEDGRTCRSKESPGPNYQRGRKWI